MAARFHLEPVSDRPSAALIRELRRGSPAAFDAIYAAERTRLYGFLVRLCRDAHVAADLFQNTWLKLARSAPKLREDTDIRAWLFTVARNEYRSHCRAQLLDMSRLLALGREHEEVPAAAPGTEAGAVEAALRELSDADREVLLLVGVEGLEPRQAATILGVSYATVRQRLARARKRLMLRLEQLERADPAHAIRSGVR